MGERLEAVLQAVGAKLLRQKKHLVYQLPNGQKLTLAKSPSDRRAEDNAITDVYHAAGVERPKQVKSTKPKTVKPGRQEPAWNLPVNSMGDALSKVPLATKKLQQRIEELEALVSSSDERVSRWQEECERAVEQRAEAVVRLERLLSSRWVRIGLRFRVLAVGKAR